MRTMPYTADRPNPAPWPGSLVVKNGSSTRRPTWAGIPTPVSSTRAITRLPYRVAERVSSPPSGMASRALKERLVKT